MREALVEAEQAARNDEVPVGAVVLHKGIVIARAQNRMRRDADATAHAECAVLREAMRLVGTAHLTECTIVVTLEPCAMCAGAIVLSRVAELVFGAWDDKAGMCGSVGDLVRHPKLNHAPQVTGGVLAEESRQLLQTFFLARRPTT